MKLIEVEITGIAPLLQHRFPTEEHGINKSKAKKQVYDPKEEAEKCLYRNAKGEIYEPAEHIFQAMVRAAVDFKFEKKKSYKDAITSGIFVTPDEIPLISDIPFEIDARGAVVQRSRIIRWRPRFNQWKLRFNIEVIDSDNISTNALKEILEKAGSAKGLGDYRPRFGRFMVTAFKDLNARPS